ncbi:MAG: chorismate synthase [Oscillospiraceae bacterium]|nr:chorismate synthase [Oscillospiraceae bacterium]
MASVWNNRIHVSVFGEAQGPAIGVTVDNLPPGEFIDVGQLHKFMERRQPGIHEGGEFMQIMSGILNDRTTGSPLCAFIQNHDVVIPDVKEQLGRLPRPGHADYTGTLRYRGFNDIRDGGHFSDRLTAPLCFAGAVAGQILERRGIYTGAHILQIHNTKDREFDSVNVTKEDLLAVRYKAFPVINSRQGSRMLKDIRAAADGGETLGGVVECVSINVPAGIGSPLFDGLENTIAQLIFGIPGVRGLEFGAGFATAKMVGSQCNDSFYVNEHGHIKTHSNMHGGILGGISSGMPITMRVAFKPAASIAQPQQTVNLSTMEEEAISLQECGASCAVPQAVPVVEACVNLALLSHMLDYPHFT